MSPTNNNLAPGFSTVDDAIALIGTDSRDNPVVDMDYMVARLKWIEVGHNFRIPKIRRLSKDEVYKNRRGRWVEFENTGDVYVAISTALERERLKAAITDKFRELVGREYQEEINRAFSTVADDAQGTAAVRPRANTPIAKEGTTIGEGTVSETNGQGLVV